MCFGRVTREVYIIIYSLSSWSPQKGNLMKDEVNDSDTGVRLHTHLVYKINVSLYYNTSMITQIKTSQWETLSQWGHTKRQYILSITNQNVLLYLSKHYMIYILSYSAKIYRTKNCLHKYIATVQITNYYALIKQGFETDMWYNWYI